MAEMFQAQSLLIFVLTTGLFFKKRYLTFPMLFPHIFSKYNLLNIPKLI